jgi:hypothetical protein
VSSPEGFEGVEIPSSLPADVGAAIQLFPLRQEECKALGFLYFLVLKAVVEPPAGGQRTIGGIYKLCAAYSRTIQSVAFTDVKRAQGIVLGLIRFLETKGLVRCSPQFAGETIANPKIALTTVEPAGRMLIPSAREFLLDSYASVMWLASGELSHEVARRIFPG